MLVSATNTLTLKSPPALLRFRTLHFLNPKFSVSFGACRIVHPPHQASSSQRVFSFAQVLDRPFLSIRLLYDYDLRFSVINCNRICVRVAVVSWMIPARGGVQSAGKKKRGRRTTKKTMRRIGVWICWWGSLRMSSRSSQREPGKQLDLFSLSPSPPTWYDPSSSISIAETLQGNTWTIHSFLITVQFFSFFFFFSRHFLSFFMPNFKLWLENCIYIYFL